MLINLASIAGKTPMEQKQDDDDASIRTDNECLQIDADLKTDLTACLVDEICNELNTITDFNQFAVDDIAFILEGLLKHLSESLKPQAISKIQNDSVIFLRHNRRTIANQSMDYIISSLESDTKQKAADLPSPEAKVNDWDWSPEGSTEMHIEEFDDTSRGTNIHDDNIHYGELHPEFYSESRAFIVQSPEFQEFLTKAATSMTLTPRRGTNLHLIYDQVTSVFARQFAYNAPIRTAMLDVRWSFKDIVQPADSFGQICSLKEVLSFTSAQGKVQAALVGSYVEQVWPITGEAVLDALDGAIRSQCIGNWVVFPPIEHQISESTHIKITQVEPNVLLEVKGRTTEVIDVIEQLAWLGSACQTSPYKGEGCSIVPKLTVEVAKHSLMLKLEFQTTRFEDTRLTSDCWRRMLCEPVIAQNFPVKARNAGEHGLELPLFLMATLGCTDQVTEFDNGMVLKGFSSIFVPMKYHVTAKSIQWHFACTLDRAGMSYWEADKINPHRRELPFISFEEMKAYRHFVGWTPAAIMQSGSNDIDYEAIGYCGSDID